MKRSLTFLVILISGLALLSGCKSKNNNNQDLQNPNSHEVKVQEFVHTSEYTYFRVTEGNQEFWIAAPKRENSKKGETLYYSTSWEMPNWKSTELDRTFDLVHFVQDLTDTPQAGMVQGGGGSQPHTGTPRNQQQQQQQTMPAINNSGPAEATGVIEGEITLDELLSNHSKYATKIVTISGKVTKFNPAIMSRNWLHITTEQADANNYDLTITTQETVEVDQVVTFQGQISINRDFGAGYSYEIIMENARLVTK